MLRFLRITLAILILSLVVNTGSFAQSILSSITGVVKDPQGGVVVGAKVVATEVRTNVPHDTTTNGSGLYTFQDLLPGTYVVSVSASGFKELRSSDIIVVSAASNRFDAELVVGDQKGEVVVVKAYASTLTADTAETGTLLTGQDLIREPLQRNLLQFLRLGSGTVSGDSSSVIIGGNSVQYENLTLDGITTTNNNFGGQSGPMNDAQSFDSIAEVKISDGNGTAETPGFASMIITTKGGSNQFHGSAFYQTDNTAFDSIGFGRSSKLKGPRLQWYGGSLGGPVWVPKVYNGHDKTFFFVTWEHRLFPPSAGNTNSFDANLPTAAFGAGDFGSICASGFTGGICNDRDPITGQIINQLCDPKNRCTFTNAGTIGTGTPIPNNNLVPAGFTLSPVALALQNNFYPTLPGGNSFQQNFIATGASPETINRYDIRIDHRFSGRDSLSGRFTRQIDDNPLNFDAGTPIFGHGAFPRQNNISLGETHSFSPSVVNEFRLGYSRDHRDFKPFHDGNAALALIGLDLGVTVPPGTRGFPSVGFSGSEIEGFGELPSAVQIGQEYSLLDNISWQKGNHSIKAGALLRYGRPQTSQGNFENQFGTFGFTGFATGFDYADFLLGLPFSESRNNDLPDVFIRKTDTGLFVQDSWHATSKLTLTYGIRWEYFMPPVDNNDRRANFDPATGNIVLASAKTSGFLNPTLPTALKFETASSAYSGRSLLTGRKTNFGPRLGVAYLLGKGTVVRGGYGIYFGQTIFAVQDSLQNGGLFGTKIDNALNSFSGPAGNQTPLFQFPSPFSTLPSAQGSACIVQCLSVSGTDPNLKAPTSQQWSLTAERDLGHSLVARVGYRGFMTTQLPVRDDLTIPRVFGDASPFPLYQSVRWTHDGGIARMNALDLILERKFASGLTFQAAYTLAKSLSDVSQINGNGDAEGGSPQNPFNRAADLGNVFFTPRHRLSNNVIWDIPFGTGQKFGSGVAKPVDYVLGGWEIAAINVIQSGDFLTPTFDPSPNTPIPNDNGNAPLRPNCSGRLSVSNPTWSQYFNTAAFSDPGTGNYGNCGVGVVNGPGLFGFNFAFYKSIKLTEKIKLRFDANMINAFNHPVINNPEPDFSTGPGTFGTIGQSASPFVKGGTPRTNNALNSSVSSGARGARHITLGLRLDF